MNVMSLLNEARALDDAELSELADKLWDEVKARRREANRRIAAMLRIGDTVRHTGRRCRSRGQVLMPDTVGKVTRIGKTRVSVLFEDGAGTWDMYGSHLQKVELNNGQDQRSPDS